MRATFLKIAARAGLAFLALAAFEGLCSIGIFAYDAVFRSRAPFAEREHTRYDEDLGWVALANQRYPDLYGPGNSLTTDARGARGSRSASAELPANKLRFVCIGDSFTLGYGVDDGQTWARRIEALDPLIETENFGQGGYGIDQALLWYRRAAADLELDFLVLAFIPEDFERMCQDAFAVYAKPWLELDGDRLVVRNVPVPQSNYRMPWLAHNRALLRKLGAFELTMRIAGDDGTRRRAARTAPIDERTAPKVAEAIFRELAAAASARGGELVLVHLPSPADPARPQRLAALAGWPRRACAAVAKEGVRFLDLAPHFEGLGPAEREAAFLSAADVVYPSAAGHYSPRGNEIVARAILEELAPLIDAAARRRALQR